MGETKHTPGPWTMETVRTSCGLCHRIGPFPSPKSWKSDKPAHACIYDDYPPQGGSPELVANARLIAAAPDLLAALKAARETLAQTCEGQHPDNICCHHLRDADAAIARATERPFPERPGNGKELPVSGNVLPNAEADAYDWDDGPNFDDDDDYLDEDCGMGPDGQCSMAGSEFCDWDCPRERMRWKK